MFRLSARQPDRHDGDLSFRAGQDWNSTPCPPKSPNTWSAIRAAPDRREPGRQCDQVTDKGEVVVEPCGEQNGLPRAVLRHDTGIGIPADKQARVFDAFEQADTSTTRQYGGTGLGLSISKQLVELFGGQPAVESEVGRGTTFKFSTRFEIQKNPVIRNKEETLEKLRELPVLVVDDNDTTCLIMVELTTAWGMKPTIAKSVDEAIQAMERAHHSGQPVKLVLTDMYMPQRDGFALIEWIRSRPEFARTQVMILTSGPTPEHRTRANELNVAAYLSKPVRQSMLFDAIAMLSLDKASKPVGAAEKPAEPETAASASVPPLQVLLAEDNPVNQETATTMLSKLGHTIVVANNGLEALQLLAQRKFDLVFMDVQMPEMDGMTAAGKIREGERATGQHVPIVAMTAHAMKGDEERCLAAGMDDYISKPIRRKTLAEVVARVVEKFSIGKGQ